MLAGRARPPLYIGRLRASALDGDGSRWLLALPFALLFLFLAIPLAAVVTTAFSDVGTQGFVDILKDPLFREALVRTVTLALVVTAICAPLAIVYSIALVVAPKPVRIFLLICLLLTFWTSLLVRTYGWLMLLQPAGALDKAFNALGLIDAPLDLLGTTGGMYPALVHVMLPFMVLPVYAALRELEPHQLRAAQSLGAGPARVLGTVVLPAVRSGLIAGCTLVFIISLGFFVTPAIIGGPDSMTVATLIDHHFRVLFDTGSAAAIGTLLMVVVLAAYVLVTRLFKVDFRVGRPG